MEECPFYERKRVFEIFDLNLGKKSRKNLEGKVAIYAIKDPLKPP